MAGILGDLSFYGVKLKEIKHYTSRVNAVTAQEVEDFAQEQFDPTEASIIVVGDAKVMGAALTTALPKAETIPVTGLDLDSPTLKTKAAQ